RRQQRRRRLPDHPGGEGRRHRAARRGGLDPAAVDLQVDGGRRRPEQRLPDGVVGDRRLQHLHVERVQPALDQVRVRGRLARLRLVPHHPGRQPGRRSRLHRRVGEDDTRLCHQAVRIVPHDHRRRRHAHRTEDAVMARFLHLPRRERARSESGVVLVWMALMLVVLLGMAGFAVDLGSWYLRSAKLQRAADAAALAGVVWMPGDPASAQAAALVALHKNGIDTSKVTVTYPPPSSNQQFRVQLSDPNVPTFFSRPFLSNVTETRSATGEYVTPVPMGSPKNTFGTGNLLPSPNTENFWAAVSGWCSGRENGDLRQPGKDQTWVGRAWTCGSTLPANDDYDPTGYLYAIDLASTPGQSIAIDIYDPAYSPTGSNADNSLKSGSSVTTTYTVYGHTASPFDSPTSTTPLYSRTFPSGTTGQNSWVNLYTLTSPTAGRYYLQVQTAANEANSYGSNGFAIRAHPASSPWNNASSVCTTITGDPAYSSTCPQVHGLADMSI